MGSLGFFIDLILQAAVWSTHPLTEMSTSGISLEGVKAVGAHG